MCMAPQVEAFSSAEVGKSLSEEMGLSLSEEAEVLLSAEDSLVTGCRAEDMSIGSATPHISLSNQHSTDGEAMLMHRVLSMLEAPCFSFSVASTLFRIEQAAWLSLS